MIMWGPPPEAYNDGFQPPAEPCLVRCLHCGVEYRSDEMVWKIDPQDGQGYWCCPVEGCDGMGYLFDIHPIDGPGGKILTWAWDDDELDEEDDAGLP